VDQLIIYGGGVSLHRFEH